MNEKKDEKIELLLSQKDLLQFLGDWFKAKGIYYSDEMFYDYYNMLNDQLYETNEMKKYLILKVQEKIFQWLNVFHNKRKDSYERVKEIEEELVPAWFLQERFKEIEMMISSKFFGYGFRDIAMEYDSTQKFFIVSLFSNKGIDDMTLGVISSDIQAYLKNQLTLLKLEESKLLDDKQVELIFSLIW